MGINVSPYARWSREKPWIFHSIPGGAVKSPVILTVNFFCKAIIKKILDWYVYIVPYTRCSREKPWIEDTEHYQVEPWKALEWEGMPGVAVKSPGYFIVYQVEPWKALWYSLLTSSVSLYINRAALVGKLNMYARAIGCWF